MRFYHGKAGVEQGNRVCLGECGACRESDKTYKRTGARLCKGALVLAQVVQLWLPESLLDGDTSKQKSLVNTNYAISLCFFCFLAKWQ